MITSHLVLLWIKTLCAEKRNNIYTTRDGQNHFIQHYTFHAYYKVLQTELSFYYWDWWQNDLIFLVSELTYNHTIKLDDENLTFDIRDAVEKVRILMFLLCLCLIRVLIYLCFLYSFMLKPYVEHITTVNVKELIECTLWPLHIIFL